MKKYRVSIKQIQPVEVWADSKEEAMDLAMEESEWDDYYEAVDEADEDTPEGHKKIFGC
ncbi:hypothetical protein M2146_002550 [Lachnospiraceae bacterium PF1-22]